MPDVDSTKPYIIKLPGLLTPSECAQTLINEDQTAIPSVTDGVGRTKRTSDVAQPQAKATGKLLEDVLNLIVRTVRTVQFGDDAATGPADYEISRLIGEGGMALVYQARQTLLDRDVAVKKIKPRELDAAARQRDEANDVRRVEQTLERRDREWFLSEAMVTANLIHPYIIPVYDVFTDAMGALYYAMEWVRGTPWNRSIRENDEAENLEILMKVADAVAFAHGHR